MTRPSHLATLVRRSHERDLGGIGAFLPGRVPVTELPHVFSRYIDACEQLPERYPRARGGVRTWLDREFARHDPEVGRAVATVDPAEAEALMTALCALGHTYRWDCVPPVAARFDEQAISLPPGIAGPWSFLAHRAGLPRVGSAWTLHLTNWTMTDRPGGAAYRPEELSRTSVRIIRNWLDPPVAAHLEAFSVAFVLMEAAGAKALVALVDVVEAMATRRVGDTIEALHRLQAAIAAITLGFSMNVRRRTVDPAVWLELIQPTYAWAAHADRPGCVEGGPSGLQLGTIQALDAALGIGGRSIVAQLAATARASMPVPHRRFLGILDGVGPALRTFVGESESHELTEQFDACVAALGSLRSTHRARGSLYLRSRPPGDVARASTGLSIGVDDAPVATFERSMNERIAETHSGMFRPSRRMECKEFLLDFTRPI